MCLAFCIKLDLIAGNSLFLDSTKIRANASIGNSWTKEKCNQILKKIDLRIEAILAECERVDQAEEGQPSYVEVKEELRDKKALKQKVKKILKKTKQ